MPLLLIFALAGSVAIHAAALFGTDIELFGGEPEPVPLLAELRPPPPPAAVPTPAARPEKSIKAVKSARPARLPVPDRPAEEVASAPLPPEPAAAPEPEPQAAVPEVVEKAVPKPVEPLLPASGAIRFSIYKESLNILVGHAEHSWEFTEGNQYHLTNVTETSGLVSLFKPLRVRAESRGHLVAGGLQPDSYRTWKNGADNNEGADFDWVNGQVHLARNDSLLPIREGAQDLLSLSYQLAYLAAPEAGGSIGIVTARKFERYPLESLGEEDIEIPAGHFHTLHLRTKTDTTTEIWIALDLHRLPVKIRYTDKKGDSFVQVATEIGNLARPVQP